MAIKVMPGIRSAAVALCLASVAVAAERTYVGKLSGELKAAPQWSIGKPLQAATPEERANIPSHPPADTKVLLGQFTAPGKLVVRVAVVQPSGAPQYLYVDTNLNQRFDPEERYALPPNGELDVHLPHPCATAPVTPVRVKLVTGWDRSQPESVSLGNTIWVVAEGYVRLAGKPTLVQYEVSCDSQTIDLAKSWQGIDSNRDGRVDTGALSWENASADGETLVFRVGTTYVSTESVDLRTRRFVLRDHPAADYQRIELAVGATMPDFAFVDAQAAHRRLSEFRGKYLLLDFWASWCGPCIADFPHLKAASDRFGPQGFQILGVNGDQKEDLEKARTVISEKQAEWPHAIGPEALGLIQKRFRIIGWPTEILLDQSGRILSVGLAGQLPLRGADLSVTLEKCCFR